MTDRGRTDPVVVDVPALRAALATIQQHRVILGDACVDLGSSAISIRHTIAALVHVVDDEFRSHQTTGGS